jgi:hypothetical protein
MMTEISGTASATAIGDHWSVMPNKKAAPEGAAL